MALSKILPASRDQSVDAANVIINGAMQINQRGDTTGLNAGSDTYGGPDRFIVYSNTPSSSAVFSALQQDTGGLAQFPECYRLDCTTQSSSALTGNEEIKIGQNIEAQNLQSLAFGTASAKSITVSFWCRSNQAQTFVLWLLRQDTSNRHTSKSFSITSANTWEYKTLTFNGDTTNVIDNDNGTGLVLNWILNAGSNYTTGTSPNGSWEALTTANRYVGLTATIGNSTSDYFDLTGVCLNVGDQAPANYPHRSYGEELALCQRYYQSMDYYYDYGSTGSAGNVFYYTNFSFPVPMRATPTMTASAWGSNTGDAQTRYTATVVNGWIMQSAIPTGCLMRGNHGNIYNYMTGRGKFDAEL